MCSNQFVGVLYEVKTPCERQLLSVCLWLTISDYKVFVGLAYRHSLQKLLRARDFCENRHSERYILLKGLNEILHFVHFL